MLVLSRKLDEIICIGDNITIQVVEVRGGKVKLGITAPGHRVDRLEVRELREAEGREGGDA